MVEFEVVDIERKETLGRFNNLYDAELCVIRSIFNDSLEKYEIWQIEFEDDFSERSTCVIADSNHNSIAV